MPDGVRPFDMQNQAIEKMKAESLKSIAKSLETISAKLDKLSELDNLTNILATLNETIKWKN